MSPGSISRRLRAQVLADAGGRCGYCRSSEEITGAPLEIEHLVPQAQGGPTHRTNLWASCRQCNALKSDRHTLTDPVTGQLTPLFNPRLQRWADHFQWTEGGATITGSSPEGRVTVITLDLNRPLLVRARRRWIAAGWHPPTE